MLDDPEFLQYFIEEGTSLIRRYKAAVKGPLCDEDQTKELFVVMHSLKGTASAVQLETLQASSRLLEQMLLPLSRSGSTLTGDRLKICQEALGPIQTIVEGAFTGEVINDPQWVKELEESLRLALDKSATPSGGTKLVAEKDASQTTQSKKSFSPKSGEDLSRAVTQLKINLSGEETVAAPLPGRDLNPPATGQTTRLVEVKLADKESPADFWGDRTRAEPIFECQFHISKDCPLVDSRLTLTKQRLGEVGELLSFEANLQDSGATLVHAQLKSDRDFGALARALVLSYVEQVKISRVGVLTTGKTAARASRRGLLKQLGRGFKESFELVEDVLGELSEGEWNPAKLGRVELALLEFGISAGALEYLGNAALALELAATLSHFSPDLVGLSDIAETMKSALSRCQIVGQPGDVDPFDIELAESLRRARGVPPVTILEGAWIVDLPDENSLLELVEVKKPWRDLRSADDLLEIARQATNGATSGRGRLRGSAPGDMSTREFGASFWISHSSSAADFPAFLGIEDHERDKPKAQPEDTTYLRPAWGELTTVPLARLELMSLWIEELKGNKDSKHIDQLVGRMAETLEQLREGKISAIVEHLRLCIRSFRQSHPEKFFDVQFDYTIETMDRRMLGPFKGLCTNLLLFILRNEAAENRARQDVQKTMIRVDFKCEKAHIDFRVTHDGASSQSSILLEEGWRQACDRLGATLLIHNEDGLRIYTLGFPRTYPLASRVLIARIGNERVALLPAASRVVELAQNQLPIRQLSDIGLGVPSGPATDAKQGVVAPKKREDRVVWAIDEVLGYEDGILVVSKRDTPFHCELTLEDGAVVPVLDLTRVSGGEL